MRPDVFGLTIGSLEGDRGERTGKGLKILRDPKETVVTPHDRGRSALLLVVDHQADKGGRQSRERGERNRGGRTKT